MASRTVSDGKMLAIWKARPTPRRTISGADSPAMSSPPSRIRPASGRSAPVMRLKKVVLPAPFGPITAVSEPVVEAQADAVHGAHAAERLAQVLDRQHVSAIAAGGARGSRASRGALGPPLDDEAEQALAQAEREHQDDDARAPGCSAR